MTGDTRGETESAPTNVARDPLPPTVLLANGMQGVCEDTPANSHAGIRVGDEAVRLDVLGTSAWLKPGEQSIVVGSGVWGCREDYETFQLDAQEDHVYLLTAWGDPTTYSERAELHEITSELTGTQGGAILVNLSSNAPSVEFTSGAGVSRTVLAPGYLVVPGPFDGEIGALPEADTGRLQELPATNHYWLVVYRDNSDGTGTEMVSQIGIPTPPQQ